MAKSKPVEWPRIIKSGSVTVKVYKTKAPSAKLGFAYTLAWIGPEGRQRRTFTDESVALEEASLKADQLRAGEIDASLMTQADRTELQAARERTGTVPLLSALDEWVAARAIVGPNVLRACEAWAEANQTSTREPVLLAAAAKIYVKAKRAAGVNVEAGIERTIPGLVTAMGHRDLDRITPELLEGYLSQFSDPGSFNSHRKRIVTMFRWLRRREYLPVNSLTAAERTDPKKEPNAVIGLVSPEELDEALTLVLDRAPAYVPALALASLCGLRRSEVHGQLWEDLYLERGFLKVSAAKPNTPAYRHVPVCDAAVAWLRPFAEKAGPVCSNLSIDRVRDICRTDGMTLAENGLRHSWISARVVVTGDIPRTSLEAGNTPATLNKHYRELMDSDQAAAWFNVFPSLPYCPLGIPPIEGDGVEADDATIDPDVRDASGLNGAVEGRAVGVAVA